MEESKLTARKTDRRTVMTKSMIKDALLELLQNTPYEKITVTALCKQSEITRATFYLHYNNIDNVLDELLDDALRQPLGLQRGKGTPHRMVTQQRRAIGPGQKQQHPLQPGAEAGDRHIRPADKSVARADNRPDRGDLPLGRQK